MKKYAYKLTNQLINELIPKYLDSTDEEEKKAISRKIYGKVLILRTLGYIQNSPHLLKEIELLRNENIKLKEEKRELEEKVRELSGLLAPIPPEKKVPTEI
ncbi:MAG: hypothetical protein DRO36_04195 [Candidatus Hecatellales archaeon]|nr:MAG: hypothetical protein DRO36_04195 [Candidatus Hecatellales archaeon]